MRCENPCCRWEKVSSVDLHRTLVRTKTSGTRFLTLVIISHPPVALTRAYSLLIRFCDFLTRNCLKYNIPRFLYALPLYATTLRVINIKNLPPRCSGADMWGPVMRSLPRVGSIFFERVRGRADVSGFAATTSPIGKANARANLCRVTSFCTKPQH